jgi:hypothetical protein
LLSTAPSTKHDAAATALHRSITALYSVSRSVSDTSHVDCGSPPRSGVCSTSTRVSSPNSVRLYTPVTVDSGMHSRLKAQVPLKQIQIAAVEEHRVDQRALVIAVQPLRRRQLKLLQHVWRQRRELLVRRRRCRRARHRLRARRADSGSTAPSELSMENLSLYRDDRWSSDSETALATALAHIKAGIVCLRVRANSYNFEALFDRACRYSEFWIVQQDNREAKQAAAGVDQPPKLFDVHLPEICVCATNGALYCSDDNYNLQKSSAIWRSLAGVDLFELCGVLKEVRDEVVRAASVVNADADTASVNVNNGSASRQRRAAATVAGERIATWSAEDVAAHTCNLDDYEIDEDETKSTKQERTKWSDLRRLAFCLSFCAPYGRGLKASALPVIEMAVRTLSFMQKELRSAYDKETDVERKRAVYGGKSFETAPSSLTRLTPRFKPKLQSSWFASYSLSAAYLTESTFLRNVVLAKDVADNYNGGNVGSLSPLG